MTLTAFSILDGSNKAIIRPPANKTIICYTYSTKNEKLTLGAEFEETQIFPTSNESLKKQ
jgi:hypothetical protein